MKTIQKKLVKTKYGTFQCNFELEKDMGGYVVESPSIQGAVSWGKTLSIAKKKIAEAIEGVIEVRVITKAQRAGFVKITHHPNISHIA